MPHLRASLIGVALFALLAASCGARDVVEVVEDDAGTPTGPRGGFRTTNVDEPFAGSGAWDFGVMSDGMNGKACDPADPELCGPGLLCCRASRELVVCMQTIRSGECPKIPNGPSGGKPTSRDPGPRPSR